MQNEIVAVTKENFENFFLLLSEEVSVLKKETLDTSLAQPLMTDLLCDHPKYEAFLLMQETNAIGFVVIEMMYSTFVAKSRLFIEDIYVSAGHRQQGIAKELIQFCLALAQQRNCHCVDGCTLDWNTGAKKFCEELGAKKINWDYYRISQ